MSEGNDNLIFPKGDEFFLYEDENEQLKVTMFKKEASDMARPANSGSLPVFYKLKVIEAYEVKKTAVPIE